MSDNNTSNNTLMDCVNTTIMREIKLEQRICYLYIMLPIAIIGIFLNLITIKVFKDKSFNTVAFSYLRFMTHVDLLICFLLLFYTTSAYTLPFSRFDLYIRSIYLVYIYIPIGNIASNLTMLITILVTIERLVAVKWPTKKYALFNLHSYYISCAAVCIIAVVVNLIYFFLYKIECKLYAVPNTKLTTNQVWRIYGYLKEVLMRIVPIIFLVIANALLIHTVRLSRARMFTRQPKTLLQATVQTPNEIKRSRQDAQLTLMTIFVAVMYSICSIPMLFAYPGLVFKEFNTLQYTVYAASVNILALSQSSFRFIIYYCFTTQFRLILKKLINKNSRHQPITHITHEPSNAASKTTKYQLQTDLQ